MKLGGFALKKGKKKALGASAGFSAAVPAAPQAPEKVFVTDFDPDAPAPLQEDGQKPLVIPLLETNSWSEAPTKNPNESQMGTFDTKSPVEIGMSADEQAAAQILAETQVAKTRSEDPKQRDLVIHINGTKEKKRAELFQDGEKRSSTDQKKPILQQNAVPGLDELQDVADKYRHDVALRPEAPDVNSDVYESVPVEAFGAALLRGMGWKGDVDPNDMGAAPQPRHKLLGLGATKRPKMPGEDKKKRKKRKDDKGQEKEKDRRSGLNTDQEPRSSRKKSRSPDRERRRRSRSRSQDRRRERKRSRSRERDRDRRDRRDRRSRSRSRSDRRSRRR